MKRIGIVAIVVTAFLAGAGVMLVVTRDTQPARGSAATATATRYRCPMHPGFTSDKPGTCAICGMALVPIEGEHGGSGAPSEERKVAYYRSPMDPTVRSDKPAKDSMGMDFVPVYEDETEGAAPVAGRAAVTLSAERRQLLGVRSEPVKKMRLAHDIRTVGRVAVDERRQHHIHTKFEGYVEHLYVDYTGQFVRRGERLLSIYSPELVATQEEYLLAHRAQAALATSAVPSAARGSIDLLEAARRRLILWDIRPDDIARLEATGQVRRTLDVHADIGGYVVQKMALHGMRVTPADTLYEIADLSHLWVLADVYEYNLPSLTLGTRGRIELASLSGKSWRGAVTYIAPVVEERTRTVKVRLEVENTSGELKPDMYADVFLSVDLGEGVVVPDGAVIHAGDRRLVFLDRGEGRFEPREVQLGIKVNGHGVQVISGLSEGERVVTAANFLLDSESSLKAALAAMSPDAQAAGHDHASPSSEVRP